MKDKNSLKLIKFKFCDMKASILRDIADKLVELADMLDKEVRQ